MTVTNMQAPVELRRSAGDRYGILAILALMGLVFAALALLGLAIAAESPGLAVFLLAMAAFIGAMTALVANEARVRWGTRITIDGDSVRLKLPGRRSLVPQAPLDREVPLAAIQAVDTRLEAFRAAGNTVLQRAYALALDDGSRIVLGGDRRMVSPFYTQAAEVLAARAGAPVRDLGTVDGTPGLLMFWGQTVPGWDAEPLAPAQAETRVRQERRAWQLVSIVVFVFLLVRLLVALF